MKDKTKEPRHINDWCDDAEVGEVVVYRGKLCRLTASRGRGKRDAGILTPVEIKPLKKKTKETHHV